MDSSTNEVTHNFPPFFKVYKDGRVERYMVMDPVPAGLDPNTGVQSKDVVICPETGVKVRIFIPRMDGSSPNQKLPVLVHYHGGGFCIGSALDVVSKNFLTYLAAQANVIAIGVEYRVAPEHPLPIAYDDSWAALKWVASHSAGLGPEPWLNQYADIGRVFLAGESAGANIAHHVAVRAGTTPLEGLKLVGVLIVHPFFGGEETDEMYKYLCPTSSGRGDDPKLNPAVDPNFSCMGAEKVMVFVAEKDWLKSRGERYYETLGKSGWDGKVEFFETKGEDHCFHMFMENENATVLKKKMVDFIKE